MTANLSVPYCTVIGFRKCLSILDQALATPAEGESPTAPPKVDRSFLVAHGLSPHAAYPVLGAFRFLGLIDDSGKPTPALAPFLSDEDIDGRRAIVELAYSRVIADVTFPVEDREVVDDILVKRHGCAQGVVAFCSTFFLWLGAEAGIPVARMSAHRRGRPPAHLAQLSDVAKSFLLKKEHDEALQEATTTNVPPVQSPVPAAPQQQAPAARSANQGV